MSYQYLDPNGVTTLWGIIKNSFGKVDGIQLQGTDLTINNKIANITTFGPASAGAAGSVGLVPTPAAGMQNSFLRGDGSWHGTATTAEPGLMSESDKSKLDNIAAGAEVNQYAFTTVKVGATSLIADSKTDTLTINAGTGITLTPITGSDSFSISTVGQANIIEKIQKNGTDLTISNKTVNIEVPTKTSDITNDSGFITIKDVPEGATASATVPKMDGTATAGTELTFARGDHVHPTDTTRAPLASPALTGIPTAPTAAEGTDTTQIATTAFVQTAALNVLSDAKDEIADAIAHITGIQYQIVQSLPATGQAGVIYLISNSGTNPNIYDEYIWVSNSFEKIGTTDVDLSGYVQTTDLVAITTAEIEAICV